VATDESDWEWWVLGGIVVGGAAVGAWWLSTRDERRVKAINAALWTDPEESDALPLLLAVGQIVRLVGPTVTNREGAKFEQVRVSSTVDVSAILGGRGGTAPDPKTTYYIRASDLA